MGQTRRPPSLTSLPRRKRSASNTRPIDPSQTKSGSGTGVGVKFSRPGRLEQSRPAAWSPANSPNALHDRTSVATSAAPCAETPPAAPSRRKQARPTALIVTGSNRIFISTAKTSCQHFSRGNASLQFRHPRPSTRLRRVSDQDNRNRTRRELMTLSLALHTRAAAGDQRLDFLERCHRVVPRRRHRQRAVGRAVIDGFMWIVELKEAVDEARREAVAAAYAVQNPEAFARLGFEELSDSPADRAPVVDGRTLYRAPRRGDNLEVRKLPPPRLHHFPEFADIDLADAFAESIDLEAKARGEILFVADHHIHLIRNPPVDLLCLLLAADAFPQRPAVVQIVADNRAMIPRASHSFLSDFGSRLAQGRVDAARVKPSHAEFAEDMLPINLPRLHLAGRRIRPVTDAQRAAHPESPLGKVEAHARIAARAVKRHPLDEAGIDAALQNEVLGEPAQIVLWKRRDNRRAQPEAPPQPARHVVFPAAFPHLELARAPHTSLPRIEAEHHLAKRDLIEGTLVARFDDER